MRRQIVFLMFAGFFGIFMTSLAASPSVEGAPGTTATTSVAVHRPNLPGSRLRDEAAMVLVGTALIGLAAAVRRVA